ncbi:MAG TPA: Nramp family divalent metal transporter, partial [Acidimicrobiales bacterium]|nr:Nramp family divalent metal transporter [Acidimicrobiales bacterium]
MATQTSTPQDEATRPTWKLVGPGLVVAATGVGAADLVATLIAGSKFGYALLWTVVVGVVMKIVLVEGAGRYSLATGDTIYEGWTRLGKWTHWYFGPYIVIWGFVYGAAAMAGTGLPLHALLPFLPVEAWGILSGLVGLALVWWGRYSLFEMVCAALVGVMFVTMVGAALLTLPNIPELLKGLVPIIPDGGLVNVLSLAGGVGGTITLAAYGYWIREKGWTTPGHMRVMRIDNTVAYVVTGIFVLATLIVGAELLYSTSVAIEQGDQGLLDLSVVLQDRYGQWAGKVFLVGFWAAAMSSLVGVWNGVSLM